MIRVQNMNKQSPKPAEEHVVEVPGKEPAVCGIVMPISAMGDYDDAHCYVSAEYLMVY